MPNAVKIIEAVMFIVLLPIAAWFVIFGISFGFLAATMWTTEIPELAMMTCRLVASCLALIVFFGAIGAVASET